MYYLNGVRLFLDKPFKDADGNQYPADWLRSSTQEQRDSIGITYTEPPAVSIYNKRFYNADGTPKPLAESQAFEVEKIRQKVAAELAETDWYAARAHDTGTPVPDAITSYRAAVRETFNSHEAQINACADIPALETLITTKAFTASWPELGEVVEYPSIDYRGFYNALLVSAVYQTIRAQAVTTPAVTVSCTEFIAAIADAKAGHPLVAAIQSCINLLMAAVTLTAEETAELQGLMDAFNLSPTLTLP